MRRFLSISCLGMALLSFSCTSPEDAENGSAQKDIEVTGSLEVSCPLSVTCDENFEYRAYAGTVDSIDFYFSFAPGFVLHRSDADAKNLFKYMYLKLNFPSLASDTSRFYQNSPTLWNTPHDSLGVFHRIESFSGDTLRGSFRATFAGMVEYIESRDPDCVSGDILGICMKYHSRPDTTVTIRYALRLVPD